MSEAAQYRGHRANVTRTLGLLTTAIAENNAANIKLYIAQANSAVAKCTDSYTSYIKTISADEDKLEKADSCYYDVVSMYSRIIDNATRCLDADDIHDIKSDKADEKLVEPSRIIT